MKKYTIALIYLFLFHILLNFLWISINQAPPSWDAALHTILTNKMYFYLQEGFSNFNLLEFLKISDYYPPIIHSFGIIFALISKGNYKVISLTGTVFFIISLAFQYLYTNRLFKNKFIAFFATFFFSFFITIYQQSRDHMLDIPMTAFLLGGLYFFEKSKLLSKRKYTLLFFIFLALAFLSKWYALIYFFIPLIFNFKEIFKKIGKKKIKNIFLGSLLFITICTPWYLANWQSVVNIASETSTGELADPQILLSKENIIFYLKLIIMFQTTLVGFVVFATSTLVALKDIKKKHIALVLGTIIFNYVFFSFISNKNIRYIIPLMPFIAIIMTQGLSYLTKKHKLVGKIFTIIVSTYFIFTYLILSFGVPIFPRYKSSLNLPIIGWTDSIYLDTYPVRILFDRKKTYNQDILNEISETNTANKSIKLLNLVDRDFLNSYNLDPLFYNKPELNIQNMQLVWLGHLRNYIEPSEMVKFLETEGVNYILLPKKQIGVIESIREYPHIERFQKFVLNESMSNFTIIAEYQLPGDDYFTPDTVYLYTKMDR